MDFANLHALPRAAEGKSAAQRLRRQGRIPAVAYGKTLASKSVAVDPNALVKILQGPHGLNTVIRLQVEGDKDDLLVLAREVTHHPVSRAFLHADFIQVKLEEDVDVEVPLIATGKAAGLVQGGIFRQIYRKLPIRCRPDAIPVNVTVDVTHLGLNTAVKAQELKLPEGVRVRLPAEQSVVSIVSPEKDRTEEAAAAPGAAAPAAGGKAAAPAAGGKAAPAAKAGDAKAAAPAAKKK
jgi:large subunit ribosomal protein L25